MLYITRWITSEDGARKLGLSKWHDGELLPLYVDEIYGVVEVQADEDELHLILNTISGIPKAENRRVVSWYGDHAKFIVGTLYRRSMEIG